MTKIDGSPETASFVYVHMSYQNGEPIIMVVAEPTVKHLGEYKLTFVGTMNDGSIELY